MSIPTGEMLNSERRQAELNQERKLRLFYRFANQADRDRAIKVIEDSRQFADELSQVDNFGPDASPEHNADGLALRLNKYDANALAKVEALLNNSGCHVVDKNEWIIEPSEQQQEVQARQQVQL